MPYRLATAQYSFAVLVKVPIAKTMGTFNYMWGGGWELNPRSSEPQSDALGQLRYAHRIMVRQEGLEPPTLCLEGRCSIQLSYWRILWSG